MKTYVDIFQRSLARAIGQGEYNHEFISRFYEIFLGRSDDIAELFHGTDMVAQRQMLHDSLVLLVDFFSSREVNPALDRIARVHARSGRDIRPELYDLWLDSLIEALSQFDPDFDAEVELSWRLVLAPGISYMKFMHNRT